MKNKALIFFICRFLQIAKLKKEKLIFRILSMYLKEIALK